MPSLTELLADQLHRTATGESWHGPSLREVLDGITAERAARRTIPGAHTIWEIVLHLTATYGLVLRRVDGDGAPLGPAEDWPAPPEPTDTNWRRDREMLSAMNARAVQTIRAFPDAALHAPLVATVPYTAFTQFAGLAQHDTYHAGQIALLARATSAAERRH